MGINITKDGVLDASYMKNSFANNVKIYIPDISGEGFNQYPITFSLVSGVSTPAIVLGTLFFNSASSI